MFVVSDVAPATDPLTEVSYKEAVERFLSTARSGRVRQIEACARYHGRLIGGLPFHPVVAAAHRAFMDHRPLCMSPDIIWLLICQGVASHVQANAEELRGQIVEHQGKLNISVRRDDLVKGSPENSWAEVIDVLVAQVEQHVGPAFDQFQPRFSTTGPIERAAAGIVLLDAMKAYFSYDVVSLCGIPAVILEGTPEDWEAIAERAEHFGPLNLEWWLKPLREILGQFVAAARGRVDRSFWQSLYKIHDQSGGPIVTGWIATFFPYLSNQESGLPVNRNPYLGADSEGSADPDLEFDTDLDDLVIEEDGDDETDLDDGGDDDDFDHENEAGILVEEWLEPTWTSPMAMDSDLDGEGWPSGPGLADIPRGVAVAPFRWEYRDRSFDMEFVGGFVGVSQDQKTLAVKPEIGWVVREAEAGS
jgi:hypothetical protein